MLHVEEGFITVRLKQRVKRLEAQAEASKSPEAVLPGPLTAALRDIWAREGYGYVPTLEEIDEEKWLHMVEPVLLRDLTDDELRALDLLLESL